MNMKINIKATNTELRSEVREYLEKRLEAVGKIIDKNDPSLMIDAELARTTSHHQAGDIFMAEFNLHIGGEMFRAVSSREDFFMAIDEAKDELMRELRSYKGKRRSLLRRSGQRIKEIVKGVYWRRRQ